MNEIDVHEESFDFFYILAFHRFHASSIVSMKYK